mmetsp:Transcript_3587/g.6420  ORF Transcript_3587/g.6420 Transcript_3587/m.6420 type:complete len:401 (+) Transcript_3587:176-1378(+)|eukprot:CAMPEP_0184696642 /NCGR_PEP_ID=MMETSP0313-20130426/3860_1 /TAXON_ID=2792 /ORGANISM="Porphyridium aerugineum, Strain SAG 1380-2" /LENGTH=400 /DNA_ID=CAMNT_0027155305 /DNA_START=848 /DNA_END=2050 /DNA_ORIENTATION=-
MDNISWSMANDPNNHGHQQHQHQSSSSLNAQECSEQSMDSCLCKDAILKQREAAIRAIHAMANLCPQQKMLEIQKVLSADWIKSQAASMMQAAQKAENAEYAPSFTDCTKKVMGCKHYSRNCKLKAACCGKLFTCRFCHDEASDHNINRYATSHVWCMTCGLIQPKSNRCIECHTIFARYYCKICGFYDNDPNKNVYHCHQCGMCRVGKGVGIDNFHCTKCNACVAIESRDRHKCVERSLDSNCPICSGYLFTSTQPVIFMRCGHTMHTHCFEQYTKTNYTCPLCCKSLSDMSGFYSRLDEVLANERLPDEYAFMRSHILCNDCGHKSHTKFHFIYHKCQNCSGYNTRVLETYSLNGQNVPVPAAVTSAAGGGGGGAAGGFMGMGMGMGMGPGPGGFRGS